jgi:hypothetical protein
MLGFAGTKRSTCKRFVTLSLQGSFSPLAVPNTLLLIYLLRLFYLLQPMPGGGYRFSGTWAQPQTTQSTLPIRRENTLKDYGCTSCSNNEEIHGPEEESHDGFWRLHFLRRTPT